MVSLGLQAEAATQTAAPARSPPHGPSQEAGDPDARLSPSTNDLISACRAENAQKVPELSTVGGEPRPSGAPTPPDC